MWNCSHSDSRCWNPVKLRLWHSPYVSILWETLSWFPPTAGGICPSAGLYSHPPSLPLSPNAAAPVSMPSSRRRYPWTRKSSPTSLPLSSACPPRPWPRPRAETWPAVPTSCKATLSECQHYRPWPLSVFVFGEWTLQRKGLMEPPSVVEEALQQDGP